MATVEHARRLLTVAQAAELLQLSTPTLRRRIREGELPVLRLGALVRIYPADLEEYVARSRSSRARPARAARRSQADPGPGGHRGNRRGRLHSLDRKGPPMTDPRRQALRSFLQAAVTGEPKADDYQALALDADTERALRRWVGVVRRAAKPALGARNGQHAAELIEEAADSLVADLPDGWEPRPENPAELAAAIARPWN
jgi:excisionase family DNA binding protein